MCLGEAMSEREAFSMLKKTHYKIADMFVKRLTEMQVIEEGVSPYTSVSRSMLHSTVADVFPISPRLMYLITRFCMF